MTDREVIDAVRPWSCLMDSEKELPALLAEVRKGKSILEIGTFKGATAAAFALACPDVKVTTMDLPDPTISRNNAQPSEECGEAIRALGLAGRIQQLRMDSAKISDWIPNASQRFDAIFVDGDHSPAAVFRDLSNAAQLLTPTGVIVAHDYTSPEDKIRPPWTVGVCEAVDLFLQLWPSFQSRRLPGWLIALELRPRATA